MGALLDLYLSGREEQVWREIGRRGQIETGAPLCADIRSVVAEFARRGRSNVDTLVERLTAAGHRFHSNDEARRPEIPHAVPGTGVGEMESWLAERFDAVPLTLTAWLREVGDVWFVGTHPQWLQSDAADPLVIEIEGARYPGHSMVEYFEGELEQADPDEDFVLPLSPDRLHKANISGGPPFGMVLPDGHVDGRFVADTPSTFVEYLNRAFRGGGFTRAAMTPAEAALRRELAEGLWTL